MLVAPVFRPNSEIIFGSLYTRPEFAANPLTKLKVLSWIVDESFALFISVKIDLMPCVFVPFIDFVLALIDLLLAVIFHLLHLQVARMGVSDQDSTNQSFRQAI